MIDMSSMGSMGSTQNIDLGLYLSWKPSATIMGKPVKSLTFFFLKKLVLSQFLLHTFQNDYNQSRKN